MLSKWWRKFSLKESINAAAHGLVTQAKPSMQAILEKYLAPDIAARATKEICDKLFDIIEKVW